MLAKEEVKDEFFRSIIDDMSDCGLFVDRTRTVRYCNSRLHDIFGYSRNDILGKSTDVLYGDRRKDPSRKNEIYDYLEENGFHIGDAKGITRDKESLDLRITTFLVKPNSGVIIVIRKITREPGVEIPIDRLHFLQNLIDNIPDMVYFKDIHNRFVLVNKAHAAALNLTPDEVVGKTDLDFFPPEIAEKYFADDTLIVKTGNPVLGKIEKARRENGDMTYVSTTKIPHCDEDGKIIGTIGITRNITDRMIAEEELRVYKDRLEDMVKERTKELEKSKEKLLRMYNIKSDFTSMVSHELRTPLAIIMEGVGIVEEGILGEVNERQKRSLSMVLKNIDRLKRLIDDILDFSKLESKKMKFNIVEGNLNERISRVLKGYEDILRKKGLRLYSELEPTLPPVKFDPDRITQVIYNLLDNAMKYTKEGSVKVSSKKENEKVVVSVEDTGCGIRKKDLNKVFESFERIDFDKGNKPPGTGLGLAICKQIIEQLGGAISAESMFGKGSRFFFTLPISY